MWNYDICPCLSQRLKMYNKENILFYLFFYYTNVLGFISLLDVFLQEKIMSWEISIIIIKTGIEHG
jgi:hypothetical protein